MMKINSSLASRNHAGINVTPKRSRPDGYGSEAFSFEPAVIDFYTPQSPRTKKRGSRLVLQYSKQLSAALDRKTNALHVTMHGNPYPIFDYSMLTSYINLVSDIENRSDVFRDEFGDWPKLNFFVIKSSAADAFSLGGDLALYARLIKSKNLKGMRSYAKACVDPLARFARGFHLPLVTISLVQGRAYGGGFELPLAGDIIIAEKQATFALPDITLNLFPGMGACTFLLRKVGERTLKTIMESGKHFTAQELHDLGVIDQVVETGQGEQALQDLIKSHKRNGAAYGAMAEARRIARGDLTEELMRIAELWAKTAMTLDARGIEFLERLALRQNRRSLKD